MWQQSKYYLQYLLKRKGNHMIHSPFLYQWTCEVLPDSDKKNYTEIEEWRRRRKLDKQEITYADLGAPSKKTQKSTRSIAQIAQVALKSPKYARILARAAAFTKANNVLELGTSLGISTAYLAQHAAKVYTIEGHASIASLAQNMFQSLSLHHIDSRVGLFDAVLPELLKEEITFDLIFIDGNHQYAPTLQYFEMLLPYLSPKGVIIFDDIYWSEEMAQAWQEIKKHPQITLTIDIFQLGFAYINPDLSKQDFVLKY